MNTYIVILVDGRELEAHGRNKRDAIKSLAPFTQPENVESIELFERRSTKV